jgi:hypothetical protein
MAADLYDLGWAALFMVLGLFHIATRRFLADRAAKSILKAIHR